MKKGFLLFLCLCCLVPFSHGQKLTEPLARKAKATNPHDKISVIITMADQYDGSGLESRTAFMSRKQRTQLVAEELKQFSLNSQADLLGLLQEAGNEVSDLQSFWIANSIGCKATPALLQAIAQRPDVRMIELDDEYETDLATYTKTTPDRLSIQWNVSQIQAPEVWAYNGETGYTGNGVIVAVLDSGVNYNHNDLKYSMWDGGSEYPYHGYNYVEGNKNPRETSSNGTGVGTMVAGVIAGQGTTIQTGVAPGAKIMALRVVNKNGVVTQSSINNGMQFAIDHGADIVVISTCMKNSAPNATFRDKMVNMLNLGIVAITSAGDNATTAAPNSINSPSSCPSPWHNPDELLNEGRSANICVGATKQNDYKASFSSIGPVTWTGVTGYNDYAYTAGSTTAVGHIRPDVMAPGLNITAASHEDNDAYNNGQGTALSAAHAAGVAALLLEADPDLTPAEIDQLLETTAVKCEGLGQKNNYYGAGRINAYDAMTALLSNVAAPTNLSANANANVVTLTWTAASGAASYNIYCNEECIATEVTGTSYTDETDFSAAHVYHVRACDAQGTLSPKSNYAYVFVDPAGPIVTNLAATANETQQKVNLTWSQPQQTSTLRYGAAESTTSEYSGQNGKILYWAQRFPTNVLVNYAGTSINSVSIYFNKYKNTTYTLTLYNGNPNGPDQALSTTTFTVASNEINAWKQVNLSSPVAIDHTKDLWIVVKDPTANPTGSNPCTANATYCIIDNDPTGFTSLYSTDGTNWSSRNNKYAWMIKANLTTGSYTYNVQRDGNTIASNKTTLSHTDTNVPGGVHYYTVTTNYNNGQSESFPCEPVRVTMNTHFTVTFNPGAGTCPVTSLTQGDDGTITLPTATPATDCASEGYTFAGWSTEIVEGTFTQPQLLLAGDSYVPMDDMTVYAVYQNAQSEFGWQQARSLQTGDKVCLVCQDYSVEFDDIADGAIYASTVSYTTDIQGAHPFTAQARDGGYSLADDEGNYLRNGNGILELTAAFSSGCIWNVEFINDNVYLRNMVGDGFQLIAKSEDGAIVIAALGYESGFENDVRLLQLYRFKGSEGVYYAHDPGCGNTVKAPQFDPMADGIYLEDLTLTLTTSTEGATIRYTTNNSEPTATSTAYNGPITLNATTTVKAKAFKDGLNPSPVVTQTYQFPTSYANIAAFKNAENPDEIAQITSNMRVTFQQDRTLYLSDNSGGLLVYDDYDVVTGTFNEGDLITLVQGRYHLDNGQPMLIPLADITAASGTPQPVAPTNVSVNTILNNYDPVDAKLVEIQNILFTHSLNNRDLNDTVSFVQNGQTMYLCNKFNTLYENIDNSYHYDITGLVGIQGSLPMLYPRSDEDIRLYHTITCAPTEHGVLTADAEQASYLSLVAVTATPDADCHLESLYYYTTNPNEHTDIDPEEPYFSMPDADVTIVAVFGEDIKYTVTFNPGNGSCATTSLTETAWNGGITLPEATPSTPCASQGYTFIGWAESYVNESMTPPVCYAAESTYHPTDNLTLYAVYSLESDEGWQEITSAQDIIEGQYIVSAFCTETNRYYYLRQQGVVSVNPLARKITRNIAPPQDTEAPQHLWDITKISDTEYSISYTENGVTYYLETYNSSAQSIRVTTNEPSRGWTFTDHSTYGMLIQFPSASTLRYMDLNEEGLASHWYSHSINRLEGINHLFLAPNNVYATEPDCQLMVPAPEFVNVPEGLILTDNYMVTITCADANATIYYTTDGSTPDNTSTVYNGPFAISESCTVNAIAYDSAGEHSDVVSQEFNFPVRVATIAEFKAAYQEVVSTSNIVTQITGDVQFVFRSGNYLYFRDETAALMVRDDNGVITSTYTNGDIIQGGLVGTYRKHYQQPMMNPTVDPGTAVSGTPVEPMVVEATDIASYYDNYDAQLVTIIDAVFNSGYDFVNNTNAPASHHGTSININDFFETMTLTGDAGEHDDITGFVGRYSNSRRIYPRDNEDFVRYYNITCATVEHGTLSATPNHARSGDEVTLNATLDPGYEVGQWTVTGPSGAITVTDNNFVMPAGEVTVTATIVLTDYQIIITADPVSYGTVTEGGTFHYGDVIELTATPNPGYRFSYWMIKGGTYTNNPRSYTVTGNDDIIAKFQTSSAMYEVQLTADGPGTVSGEGSFLSGTPVTVTATPDEGYQFLNWTENGQVVSTNAAYTFVIQRSHNLTAHFGEGSGDTEQIFDLSAGWNWMSSYIECTPELFTALKDGIAANNTTAMIKDMSYSTMLQGGSWSDSDLEFVNESMYMANLESATTVTLTAAPANPAAHPITLASGWNWIGFVSANAIEVNEALASLTPTNGDLIKNMTGASSYNGTEWQGSLENMMPGSGYMYYNKGAQMTLTYPASAKGVIRTLPVEKYWSTNVHEHATNLVLMATLDETQFAMTNGAYEIGAFVGDECRGSALLQKAGNGYVAFVVIHGDSGETVSFKLYDVMNAVEAGDAEEQLTYVANAIRGSIEAPMVLHFRGCTDINETANSVKVYPNPANEWIMIEGEGLQTVSLFSLTGQQVLQTTVHDQSTRLSVDGLTPGLYLIQMVKTDGSTLVRKLEIK